MQWADYERDDGKILIRDMKNPTKKEGNDVFVKVLDEQALILEAMPRQGDRTFPYNKDTISRLFTAGCQGARSRTYTCMTSATKGFLAFSKWVLALVK